MRQEGCVKENGCKNVREFPKPSEYSVCITKMYNFLFRQSQDAMIRSYLMEPTNSSAMHKPRMESSDRSIPPL